MTWNEWLVMLFPASWILMVGMLLDVFFPGQWLAATFAIALTLPAAVGTALLMKWMTCRNPRAAVLGMFAGILIRGIVALGGSVAIYFGTSWLAASGISFWFWLSVAYLSVLAGETIALTQSFSRSVQRGGVEIKG